MAFAYYNENDPVAVEWLRWLIGQGLIANGWVDERSIVDVEPRDLEGYTQHHFFAGIGGWSLAAGRAGWPDDKPLWTASCPCQPFSVAGKGAGVDDERHLWPHVLRLVSACQPAVLVGEQVAGKAGYGWLDGVRADLAGEGYACRGVDIPACAVDAPHIRQRLYWVAVGDPDTLRQRQQEGGQSDERRRHLHADAADLEHATSIGREEGRPEHDVRGGRSAVAGADAPIAVANTDCSGRDRRSEAPQWSEVKRDAVERLDGDVGDAIGQGLQGQRRDEPGTPGWPNPDRSGSAPDDRDSGSNMANAHQLVGRFGNQQPARQQPQHEQDTGVSLWTGSGHESFWSDHEWIICHDGKARRTQPGLPMLVDGLPGRVAAWRGFGNAISPPLAAEVLKAFLEVEDENLL